MQNKKYFLIIIMLSILVIAGCNIDNKKAEKNNILKTNDVVDVNNDEIEVINAVKITINGEEYVINLDNNETATAFIDLLPQKFTMYELNGNEKYAYLSNSLPTNSYSPKYINAGDVMLYGDNCLVIFYKSFETSYSYTKIGHIEDLSDLGSNYITVKIEK